VALNCFTGGTPKLLARRFNQALLMAKIISEKIFY
jgi:hypothetical protein